MIFWCSVDQVSLVGSSNWLSRIGVRWIKCRWLVLVTGCQELVFGGSSVAGWV
jgi:hypothetical protein